MYTLSFLGVVSFVLSLLLTPLMRNVFFQWGVVDHPNPERKQHQRAVPRIGGIPLLVSYLCSFGLLLLAHLSAVTLVRDAVPFALHFLPAVLLIFVTGLLDDLIGLKPWQKLAGQMAASGAAYWAGVHVQGFGGHVFADWLSLPLTLFWLVLCTNAMNLIDGVDGLAVGVGLFAATATLLVALLQHNMGLAIVTMPLVGALLGFLRYNFNPATIFLGDSGSLFVGFLLGSYGVLWSQKSTTILGMTAPLMALAIPLLDTTLSIVRRFLSGKPIFTADRGHIHHRLLDRGLTPRRVALIFYGVCGLAAIFSLSMASQHLEGLVLILFCATAWIGIQHLGYVELGVAGRMFTGGAFRRLLSTQITLQQYQQRLVVAATPQECWTVIEDAARDFKFQRVRMELGGYRFRYEDEWGIARSWEIRIRLSESDSIELAASSGESAHAAVIAPLADMLQRTISENDALAAKAVAAVGGRY